ncbi:hypothetical protein STTU_5596 [Streptomyces sp. Tu6071]|nr:hypothetical protein STTU_5596 [Streptomyces sp. Tu6071]
MAASAPRPPPGPASPPRPAPTGLRTDARPEGGVRTLRPR